MVAATYAAHRPRGACGTAVVIVVLLAAGCGSTVDTANMIDSSIVLDGPGTTSGLEATRSTTAPATSSPVATPDSTSTAVVDTSVATTRSGAADTTPDLPPSAAGTPVLLAPSSKLASPPDRSCPAAAAQAAGITDEEILVGAPRFTDMAVAAQSVGFDRPNHTVEQYIATYVADVNDTGGIACRQVSIVWHDVSIADGSALGPAYEQSMCATWTQDHHVFVAFPAVDGPGEVLYPCLDRARVPILDVIGGSFRDRQGFDQVPHLIAVNSPRLDRGVVAQVHALVRQGFLDVDSKIGIVHYDDGPTTRTTEEALVPTLAVHGLAPIETRAVLAPRGPHDLAARDQELANVVLRFKMSGIDRVLFVGGDGLAAGFMRAAESNQYRPRYGLTTIHLPVAAVGNVPRRQLVGATGIGWFPDFDGWDNLPDESWPARTACLDFWLEQGFEVTTPLDRHWALETCDGVGFLQAAVNAAPGPLSADAVLAGVRALGDTWESATVQWTRFGPDRRDGANGYRDVAYDQPCECFLHHGPPRSLDHPDR